MLLIPFSPIQTMEIPSTIIDRLMKILSGKILNTSRDKTAKRWFCASLHLSL
jgi:hypothetical protein